MIKSPIINLMNDACLESSRQLIRDFKELSFLKTQNNVDKFINTMKLRVSQIIQSNLMRTNIGHGMIIDNQMRKKSQTGSYWIINIIDSKENFAHRLPFFGMSLSMVHNLEIEENFDLTSVVNKIWQAKNSLDSNKPEIACGMFYTPMNDENFWAQAKYGAFLNDRKLFANKNSEKNIVNLIAGQQKECNRNFGSSILHIAYLSANRIDCVISKIDDLAQFCVAKILLDEIRGYMQLIDGNMVAANGLLIDFAFLNK